MKTFKMWNPEIVINHTNLDGETCTGEQLTDWEEKNGMGMSTLIEVNDAHQLDQIWNLVNNETNCGLRYWEVESKEEKALRELKKINAKCAGEFYKQVNENSEEGVDVVLQYRLTLEGDWIDDYSEEGAPFFNSENMWQWRVKPIVVRYIVELSEGGYSSKYFCCESEAEEWQARGVGRKGKVIKLMEEV